MNLITVDFDEVRHHEYFATTSGKRDADGPGGEGGRTPDD